MTTPIDLDAYFERIGAARPHRADFEALRTIHWHHVTTIPFENLNPLLGWPIALDAPALEKKLVHDRRGGYCYEQNLLLSHVLRALGFDVTGLLARVRWMVPHHQSTARTHMLLLIRLDGERYIGDVGFGGQTLTAPVRLIADVEQPTPHEPFRLLHDEGVWTLEALLGSGWRSLYQFDLTPEHLPDFEVSNWYTSTSPKSHFTTGLSAALAAEGRRYALRNAELAIHSPSASTVRRTLTSGEEIRSVLTSTFGLHLPDTPELESILDRVAGLRD